MIITKWKEREVIFLKTLPFYEKEDFTFDILHRTENLFRKKYGSLNLDHKILLLPIFYKMLVIW